MDPIRLEQAAGQGQLEPDPAREPGGRLQPGRGFGVVSSGFSSLPITPVEVFEAARLDPGTLGQFLVSAGFIQPVTK